MRRAGLIALVVLLAAPQALALPGFGTYAVGAVGFDGLLAAGNEQAPMATASITKVITALVVLEEHPIAPGEGGPEITYTDADVAIYWDMIAQNGSVAPVQAGATLTLRESLEAMLLPSGNNYAISIANWGFGSVDAFLERARTWLDARGLANTRIADSSGLSLDNVSTAAELVRLGELALENPVLAEIVATADRRGYAELFLETGHGAPFDAAHALYTRFGFEPCGPFADYTDDPFSRFFRLVVTPSTP